MAVLTIRQVDDAVHKAIREQAARNGRSVEAEVRAILTEHCTPIRPLGSWAQGLRERARSRSAGRQQTDSADLIREGRDAR